MKRDTPFIVTKPKKKKLKARVAEPVKKKVKKFTMFHPRVRSRHPSHSPLRTQLKLLPFKSVVRLGSTTSSNLNIECNSVEAVKNSADKQRMKMAFQQGQVKTANWMRIGAFVENQAGLEFPVIIKHRFGSRGEGIYLINNQQELTAWIPGKTLENYIVEKYHDYSREYRLHVTKDGCFYACRKMIKNDTPEDERWYRNDSNCTWIMEENPAFDKPVNWNAIVAECVKAIRAVGLDVGACDVKIQSASKTNGTRRTEPKFIILEVNSAPSFGAVTLQKYLVEIPKILKAKFVETI